jgi:hypothetical protein
LGKLDRKNRGDFPQQKWWFPIDVPNTTDPFHGFLMVFAQEI